MWMAAEVVVTGITLKEGKVEKMNVV